MEKTKNHFPLQGWADPKGAKSKIGPEVQLKHEIIVSAGSFRARRIAPMNSYKVVPFGAQPGDFPSGKTNSDEQKFWKLVNGPSGIRTRNQGIMSPLL